MPSIRPFHDQDADLLWQLKYKTIRNVNSKDYNTRQIEVWAPDDKCLIEWKEQISKMQPFVAELNETIAGFADLQSNGYIDHFYLMETTI